METQKIVSLLSGSDNDKIQSLQLKVGTLLTVNQMIIILKMMRSIEDQ